MPFANHIPCRKLWMGGLWFFLLSCNGKERDIRGISDDSGMLALVYYNDNGKAGLMDTNYNVLLPAQFDYIEDFQAFGLIRVDSGGRPAQCGDDCVGYDFQKYGLINTQGKVLFRPQFDDLRITDCSALVRVDSLYGYVGSQGEWLIKPRFRKAEPFYKGTAVVEDSTGFVLLNKSGERITEQVFDTIWSFKNDVAVVEKNKKWGYINYRGKLILPLDDYRGIGDFNWYYGAYKIGEQWFVVDTAGNLPIQEGFDDVRIRGNEDSTVAVGVRKGKPVRVRLR